MGCDGGSIAKRSDIVKHKKEKKEGDKTELNRIKWTCCSISKEVLKEPIVVDLAGNLFNKESLINCLLGKNIPEAFSHIKSLKVKNFAKEFEKSCGNINAL